MKFPHSAACRFGFFFSLLLLAFAACNSSKNDSRGRLIQVDRVGLPLISRLLITSDRWQSFNESDPRSDANTFGDALRDGITNLRNAVNASGVSPQPDGAVAIETAQAFVTPDVIEFDLSRPNVFPNGRRIEDDSTDSMLGILLDRGNGLGGGPGLSDNVSSTVSASQNFPHLR